MHSSVQSHGYRQSNDMFFKENLRVIVNILNIYLPSFKSYMLYAYTLPAIGMLYFTDWYYFFAKNPKSSLKCCLMMSLNYLIGTSWKGGRANLSQIKPTLKYYTPYNLLYPIHHVRVLYYTLTWKLISCLIHHIRIPRKYTSCHLHMYNVEKLDVCFKVRSYS